MADDSPGKVQALRAIFSEKNHPVMGMMPPGSKVTNRPWRSVENTNDNKPSLEKKINNFKLGSKVLPVLEKKSVFYGHSYKETNTSTDKLVKNVPKPTIGPKPTHLQQHQRTNTTTTTAQYSSSQSTNNLQQRISDELKSKAVGQTIASFMFTTTSNNKENKTVNNSTDSCLPPPLPKPRSSKLHNCLQKNVDILNFCNGINESDLESQRCGLINSDNYICKGDYRMRLKTLPSREKLGPAPLKPIKPTHMKLPLSNSSSSSAESSTTSSSVSSSQVPLQVQKSIPQRPPYPCPPRPATPPPLPPVTPVIKSSSGSLREEIEELYEDTLLGEKGRPVSLIPEYTEEEEAEELYNDAVEEESSGNSTSSSLQYIKSSASEYLQPNVHSCNNAEELYQDADANGDEEFYEVMPCDEVPDESGSPLYSNNKKEIEKLKKEEEKKLRKEQKEREKKEKELEKLRKKFGLTGTEIPIDDGLVKSDSRGGKGDLPVKKGETVLILRMEGNPSGRWLVKNEKGKIGYVELTNIEVDPLSVKSVMSIRRLSMISGGEELYCEAKSEEEAIYEVTY